MVSVGEESFFAMHVHHKFATLIYTFWVGVCRPYPITDQVKLILQPYTRLHTENLYYIPDFLFLRTVALLVFLLENHNDNFIYI